LNCTLLIWLDMSRSELRAKENFPHPADQRPH
jgi:hypothetical protein